MLPNKLVSFNKGLKIPGETTSFMYLKYLYLIYHFPTPLKVI